MVVFVRKIYIYLLRHQICKIKFETLYERASSSPFSTWENKIELCRFPTRGLSPSTFPISTPPKTLQNPPPLTILKMRGVFLKNGLVHRFSQIWKSADAKNPFLVPRDRDARGSHHYHNLLNKSRESASGAFSIPFSSSSSPSRSRVGFVAWYLGLVQSRPLLTKSVTSSLIYAAADCTSQV